MDDEQKYLQLLGKVLSREATPAEQRVLEQWSKQHPNNQKFVQETTLIWEKSAQYKSTTTSDKEAAWARLEARVEASSPTKVVRLKSMWYRVVAAVLVVGIGLGWWYQSQQAVPAEEVQPILASITTGEDERQEVRLPDGSVVWLNEHSQLQYDRQFKTREVQLEGEAFFEVAKNPNSPFEIITKETRTTVLGTSFNVRAYANQATEVAVLTGKVAFEALDPAKGERVLLLAQDVAQYQKEEGIKQSKATDNNALAWKTQTLEFNNQRLSAVIAVLERYYGVTIEGSEGLLNCHYTGNFNQLELDEVLNTIAFAFPTEVKIEKNNDQYVLTGQGCD